MVSRISFAGKTDALAVAGTGLDANFERLSFRNRAVTVAGRASRQVFSGSVTARTLDVELHTPAGLRNLAGTVALRTLAGSFESALAMALGADVLTGDVEAHHATADRRPEGDVYLV